MIKPAQNAEPTLAHVLTTGGYREISAGVSGWRALEGAELHIWWVGALGGRTQLWGLVRPAKQCMPPTDVGISLKMAAADKRGASSAAEAPPSAVGGGSAAPLSKCILCLKPWDVYLGEHIAL